MEETVTSPSNSEKMRDGTASSKFVRFPRQGVQLDRLAMKAEYRQWAAASMYCRATAIPIHSHPLYIIMPSTSLHTLHPLPMNSILFRPSSGHQQSFDVQVTEANLDLKLELQEFCVSTGFMSHESRMSDDPVGPSCRWHELTWVSRSP